MLEFFLKLPHVCLTFLHHISKIWEGVLQFLFHWIFSQCELRCYVSDSSLTVLRAADGSSLAVLKAADGSKQPS